MLAAGRFRLRWLGLALLPIVILWLGYAGWESSARFRGRTVARFELAHGRYEILTLGLPTPWRPEFARHLEERYGIKLRVVAGCIVSESLLEYVAGYNAVMALGAHRKFGRSVIEEVSLEEMEIWKARAEGAGR